MNMSSLEHPDITMAQATGYPSPTHEPVCWCDRCKREVNAGDVYYDTGEEYVCERCMSRCRRTAGEEQYG